MLWQLFLLILYHRVEKGRKKQRMKSMSPVDTVTYCGKQCVRETSMISLVQSHQNSWGEKGWTLAKAGGPGVWLGIWVQAAWLVVLALSLNHVTYFYFLVIERETDRHTRALLSSNIGRYWGIKPGFTGMQILWFNALSYLSSSQAVV